MDFTKTLAALDSMLAAPKVTSMTKAQFDAYVQDQITKAKAEAVEDEKKAKKRLEHLRDTMRSLSKADDFGITGSWAGDNGTQLIPEYVEDTTRKTEQSETQMTTPPAGNQGTQADGSSVFAGGQPSYDQQPNTQAAPGTSVFPSGQGTQQDGASFAQGNETTFGKALDAVAKTLESMNGAVPAKAAPPSAKKGYNWPSDVANPEYLKDGVAKRAPDHWGGTDKAAAK